MSDPLEKYVKFPVRVYIHTYTFSYYLNERQTSGISNDYARNWTRMKKNYAYNNIVKIYVQMYYQVVHIYVQFL